MPSYLKLASSVGMNFLLCINDVMLIKTSDNFTSAFTVTMNSLHAAQKHSMAPPEDYHEGRNVSPNAINVQWCRKCLKSYELKVNFPLCIIKNHAM